MAQAGLRCIRLCMVAVMVAQVALAGCQGPTTRPLPGDQPRDDLDVFMAHDDPVLGDLDAPVLVVAWEAPACGVCRHFHLGAHDGSLSELKATYFDTGRAAYVAMQWTIGASFDHKAGVAQECVFAHGGDDAAQAYFDLTRLVYEHQHDDQALQDSVDTVVAAHALDAAAVASCIQGQESLPAVQQDIDSGRDHIGSRSPGFLVLADGHVSGPHNARDMAAALARSA